MTREATCGGCDAVFKGLRTAHCAACHITFGGVGSFDRHRKRGRCRPPAEIGLVWNPVRHCWSERFRPEGRPLSVPLAAERQLAGTSPTKRGSRPAAGL